MVDVSEARTVRLLAGLTVVVDGVGEAATHVASALRQVGVGQVRTGAYAADAAFWGTSPTEGFASVAAVVFVRTGPLDPAEGEAWSRVRAVQLPVSLKAHQAVIGPLVVPGVGSCLHCHARLRQSRAAADPETAVAADACEVPRPDVGLPDPGLIILTAAITAMTLCAALQGDHDLAGISSEVRAGRPDVIHRHWPRQPDCACAGAAQPTAGATPWRMGA